MQKMDTVLTKVKEYVNKYHMLAAGDTVVAGVSGGADSVCLLFVLQEIRKEIPFRLLVVHVNHKIRREAGQDAAYVEKLCVQMELPFYLYERDVQVLAKEQGMSAEEAGRQVRYEAFREVLQKEAPLAVKSGSAKIAVAHNKNDRAETMLFQLFRGSGLQGLIGIRPIRECIIRPLLCLERKEIEAFLREKSVSYCIDFTNEEDTYTRNKIRHHILPMAENEICHNAVEHMAGTADILAEAQDLLEVQTETAFQTCAVLNPNQVLIRTEDFANLHPYLKRQVLFRAVEYLSFSRKDITAVHIQSVLSLFEKEGNRKICLPYGVCAKRQYEQVIFQKAKEEAEQKKTVDEVYPVGDLSQETFSKQVSIPGFGTLEFTGTDQIPDNFGTLEEKQYTKWFDYDKIKQVLTIRTRRTGDFLTINDTGGRQSVKKYMIQEKIPADKRDSIWLLADGSHIVWIPGYRISAEYKIDENTKYILKVQLRGGQ